jgi:hypothetical protein
MLLSRLETMLTKTTHTHTHTHTHAHTHPSNTQKHSKHSKTQKHSKNSKTKNRLLSRLETLLPNALKLVALVSENEFLPITGDNLVLKSPYILTLTQIKG